MGWMDSDTRMLKNRLAEFSAVNEYQTTPKALAKTVVQGGTSCLLGEANCESFLKECVLESARKNSKAFVPFRMRDGLYCDALVEAGMLTRGENRNVTFTPPGVALLCRWYRLWNA